MAHKEDHPLDKYLSQYSSKTKLLISLLLGFILIVISVALLVPFKDTLLSYLYPKGKSEASGGVTKPKVLTSTNPLDYQFGFVALSGDLQQFALKALNTSLTYEYNYTLDEINYPNRKVFMIGKHAGNQHGSPDDLKVLMDVGKLSPKLTNTSFENGLNSWNIWVEKADGSAVAGTDNDLAGREETEGAGVAVVSLGNQRGIAQVQQQYKGEVIDDNRGKAIIGAWVKTDNPASTRIFLQSTTSGAEMPCVLNDIEPNVWYYAIGFCYNLPAGRDHLQLVLRRINVTGTTKFDGAAAVVIGSDSQTLQDIVTQRPGVYWLIGNEPNLEGFHGDQSTPLNKGMTPEAYALLYHQFYTKIKQYDPTAKVMPGGFAGPGIGSNSDRYPLDNGSHQGWITKWRTAHKTAFGPEPTIDAFNIHYYLNSDYLIYPNDFSNFLQDARSYVNAVSEWSAKPIWLTEFGVVDYKTAGHDQPAEFLRDGINYIKNHPAVLNNGKAFFYNTCSGLPRLAPLLKENRDANGNFTGCSAQLNDLSNIGLEFAKQQPLDSAPTIDGPFTTAGKASCIWRAPNGITDSFWVDISWTNASVDKVSISTNSSNWAAGLVGEKTVTKNDLSTSTSSGFSPSNQLSPDTTYYVKTYRSSDSRWSPAASFNYPACPTPTPTPTPTPRPQPTPPAPVCTPCTADITGDKNVNTSDFSLWKACRTRGITMPKCSNADIDKDGQITSKDFECIRSNFGKICKP